MDDDLDDYKLETTWHQDPNYVVHVSFERDRRHGRKVKIENKWYRRKELGIGSCGIVHLESTEDGRRQRAVKSIRKSQAERLKIDYRRELAAISTFSKAKYQQHQIFVDFLGWFENAGFIFLAMEYLPLGDLSKHISEDIKECDLKDISSQLLEGLKLMHSKGFTHRDLKPQNIFVLEKKPSWWVKIGDFGIAKRVRDCDATELRTATGTQGYEAPEIRGYVEADESNPSSIYTNAVDVWSFGCVIYNAVAKRVPFQSGLDIKRFCDQTIQFPTGPLEGKLTIDGIDFLRSVLVPKPLARPSVETALQHHWLLNDDEFIDVPPDHSSSSVENSTRINPKQAEMEQSKVVPEFEPVQNDFNVSSTPPIIPSWSLRFPPPRLSGPHIRNLPPPPPLGARGTIRISDITPAPTLNEDYPPQKLTTYEVYTLRKAEPLPTMEEKDGKKISRSSPKSAPKPSWQRVLITREAFDQKDIIKQIKKLDQTTPLVTTKKAALFPNQHAQVTRLVDDLVAAEPDPAFTWILRQLERKEVHNRSTRTMQTETMTVYLKRTLIASIYPSSILSNIERNSKRNNERADVTREMPSRSPSLYGWEPRHVIDATQATEPPAYNNPMYSTARAGTKNSDDMLQGVRSAGVGPAAEAHAVAADVFADGAAAATRVAATPSHPLDLTRRSPKSIAHPDGSPQRYPDHKSSDAQNRDGRSLNGSLGRREDRSMELGDPYRWDGLIREDMVLRNGSRRAPFDLPGIEPRWEGQYSDEGATAYLRNPFAPTTRRRDNRQYEGGGF